MKNHQRLSASFLLGILLSSNTVVANDAGHLATGHATPTSVSQPLASVPRHTAALTSAPTVAAKSSATTNGVPARTLPSLPAGVAELRFNEFFRQPIGSRGLEYTEKLRALDGRRIRILGYMARQAKPTEHGFLLAPMPLTLNEIEYGHADDLPATTLHVFTTAEAPAQTPYTPGPLLLTGTLSLGNRLEADGRTSTVRLQLDPPTAEQQAAAHAAAQAAPAADPHAGHQH